MFSCYNEASLNGSGQLGGGKGGEQLQMHQYISLTG